MYLCIVFQGGYNHMRQSELTVNDTIGSQILLQQDIPEPVSTYHLFKIRIIGIKQVI